MKNISKKHRKSKKISGQKIQKYGLSAILKFCFLEITNYQKNLTCSKGTLRESNLIKSLALYKIKGSQVLREVLTIIVPSNKSKSPLR